jgi:GDP-L-fucose synthase
VQLHGKTALVTGGAGFLGRHVVARLRACGCRAVVVPRSRDCDLTHEADTQHLLRQYRPDVVVHLAAVVGGIEANRRSPGTFLYKNLTMGAHLIEHCRRAGVQKLLIAGTICSYPRLAPVPFRECDLWLGYPEGTNAPYGLAKKMLLVQLQAYRREFGLNGISLLLTNLYGPGDSFAPETSHVIPALIRKCVAARERGEPVVHVWGTGQATREFLYVEDAARAIQLALEHYDSAEPVNVGSGQEMSIAALARRIAQRTGFEGELRFDATRPDGQPRRCLDIARARELFHFEAATPFEEGLDRTIAWYEATRRPRSAAQVQDAPTVELPAGVGELLT